MGTCAARPAAPPAAAGAAGAPVAPDTTTPLVPALSPTTAKPTMDSGSLTTLSTSVGSPVHHVPTGSERAAGTGATCPFHHGAAGAAGMGSAFEAVAAEDTLDPATLNALSFATEDDPIPLGAFECLPDIVIVLNRDSIVEFANANVSFLGYTPQQLKGRNIQILIPQSYNIRHTDLTRRFTVGMPSRIVGSTGRHVEVLKADHTRVPMRLSVSLRNNLFYGILADVQNYVSQATRREQEFQAYIMHECRNFMQSVHGALEVMSAAGSLDEVQQCLPLAAAGSNNVLQMFNNLAQVNSLDSDSFEYHKEWFLGQTFMDGLLSLLSPVVKPPLTLTINFSAFDSSLQYFGDMLRLRQIALNIVSNATRFAASGITLTATTTRIDSDAYLVSLNVEDDGTGVPDDQQAAIFEKFKRLRTGDDANRGGCGLGLYICRMFARAHGGDVFLQSPVPASGRGCRFTVTLRLSARAVPSVATQTDSKDMEGTLHAQLPSNMRVLIVDDVKSNCILFTSILRKICPRDAVVSAAYNGRECRDIVTATLPHVCFIDEDMPDEQGSAIIPYIKAISPGTIVISVTGATDTATHTRIQVAGADAILPKPIGRLEFVKILEKYAHVLPGWSMPVGDTGASPSSTSASSSM